MSLFHHTSTVMAVCLLVKRMLTFDDRFSTREANFRLSQRAFALITAPDPALSLTRLSCAEEGNEMDIIKLLQSTGADALDRIAYNLKIEHPQNGFYDTPAFKSIRSKELAAAHRARNVSALMQRSSRKRGLSTSNPHSRAPAQRPRGEPKPGGMGRVPQDGKKIKNGATKFRSVKR